MIEGIIREGSILEAAVDRGLAQASAGQVQEQLEKLLRQVGQLENRNASLEVGLRAVAAKCYWRVMGFCDLGCGGLAFCNVEGLHGFDWSQVREQV